MGKGLQVVDPKAKREMAYRDVFIYEKAILQSFEKQDKQTLKKCNNDEHVI